MSTIYHLAQKPYWEAAERSGLYAGGPNDVRDGFIHFSSNTEIETSASLYCKGMADLILVAVNSEKLGPILKWENSRDGVFFPHLYGNLDTTLVEWTKLLTVGKDGRHEFPSLD
ncbi:MAG: dihydroorotate dehydrogenase [Rhodospirillaceae bacterium]|nr:dihydroorotate dehydrogenase [Rhodospirillaceae bacterium]|tara:strand:+ start:251 stop:592 length:342 start_codon:yes stop_codon:yes gene_type:complete